VPSRYRDDAGRGGGNGVPRLTGKSHGVTVTRTLDPHLQSISAVLPRPNWSTEDLLKAAGGRLSEPLAAMLRQLGVERRHSVLANYPDFFLAHPRGVVGLRPDRLPHEHSPGIAVQPMGVDRRAVASHLLSSCFSAAVLVDDVLGMLERVQVAHSHEYA